MLAFLVGLMAAKRQNQAVNRSGEVKRFDNEKSFVAARLRRAFGDEMNSHKRQCPHCQTLLDDVRQYGDIELGHCGQCGDVPLATVYQGRSMMVRVSHRSKRLH